MKIAEVIKYEGDNSTFVWKHPSEDFNTKSQLIVHESQEAIFFMNGQLLDSFGPGRHTLDTQNIPLIGKFYNKIFDNESPFHCYVATAVYGSYDCPEVWTLRRYRDYELDSTWYGRAFIKTYYAISPTIVKWFGETEWFKKLWKGKLDKMVAKLQEQGYENTRYNDKY